MWRRVKDSSGSGLGQLAGSWERVVGYSGTKNEISWLDEEKLTSQEGLLHGQGYLVPYLTDFNKIFVSWFNIT